MEFEDRTKLELWGGVECTVNRVHGEYFEQIRRTGHVARISDFERFAALGIRALRQPILWECEPSHSSETDRWEWASAALRELTALGIRPIVGLVHHGSGPRSTHLLDPDFPAKLARYAHEVAVRFPDVRDYTPVNEPLTTARFSALYGHWYPHHSDEYSFARALLNECRAIVMSMEAIRQINPSARLIQTEDLGKMHSTPALAYQAEFENERRWSTFDLLCGRVNREHRMWQHFRFAGIKESELNWFLEHPCPPDIIGVNHYLSGERYLDEHLERYSAETHGGNGRHRYADVPAARVLRDGISGLEALLLECWERYKRPIAVTECHNGCTREEQLRWFAEVWRAAEKARLRGAEVVAITAWALLGSFDWNSLVTQKNDHYEPGVYDIRSSPPRPTALANVVHKLAAGRQPSTSLLSVPGWWHRPRRFEYGIAVDDRGEAYPARRECINDEYPDVMPVLITGAKDGLRSAFARLCELRGIPYRTLAPSLVAANPRWIQRAFAELKPWAVIDTGCSARADDAEFDTPIDRGESIPFAELLARECRRRKVQLLTLSSDIVFDGQKGSGYLESDAVAPCSADGLREAEIEGIVQSEMPAALIVRHGPLFGPWDESSFVAHAVRALSTGGLLLASNDRIVSPTYIPDLVDACLDLLIDGERGVWHIAHPVEVSWADVAIMVANIGGFSTHNLRSCESAEVGLYGRVPANFALASERAVLLPTLEDAVRRFIRDCGIPEARLDRTTQALAA